MFGSSMLKRPALGQAAPLGTLYDARNDSFVGISILKENLPEEAIKMTQTHSMDVKIRRSNTYKEKFNHMGMEAGLSASFLAGLVDVEGSGKFLKDKARGSMFTQVSLCYDTTTVEESLNFSSMKDYLQFDRFKAEYATHVVTSIAWGAKCIVTAQYKLSREEDRGHFSGRLEAKLATLGVGGGGLTDISVEKGKGDLQSQFELTVYGDVLAQGGFLPTDIESAKQFLAKVPEYIASQNGGKGKPLLYTLMPIQMITMFFQLPIKVDDIIVQLSYECLEKFVQLFDEVRMAQQKLTEYHTRVQNHRFCLPPTYIRDVTDQLGGLNAAESNLKSRYAATLKEVRAGAADAAKLWKLHEKFSGGDFAPEKLASMAHMYTEKLDFVDLVETAGATYIGYQRSLATELMKHTAENAKTNKKTVVFVVDCDATGHQLEKVHITHRRGGRMITEDLLEYQKLMSDNCLMEYSKEHLDRSQTSKPITRKAVKIPCPNLYCQPSPPTDWICFTCHAPVEFGHVDDFLYCECGRCHYKHWGFKCKSEKHDLTFAKYDDTKLRTLLEALEPFEELNILILGETGVGKSTWINAFINYITFDSLREAMNAGDLKYAIPFSFSTQRGDNNGTLVPTTIKYGSSEDENNSSLGESATQRTIVHAVLIGETRVRLIDTPGIGDTRGVDQDKKNMEDILATLAQYPKIHGILILIPPNTTRLSTMFQFCIKELLTHLHRNAVRNMVFGFTNTGPDLKPGDTFTPLNTILSKYKEANLQLAHRTVYCFESESFRYLAAHKKGFDMGRYDGNASSWQWSVDECERLIAHFQSISPHLVESTISLNQARQIVLQLARPMAKITEIIKSTIAVNKDDLEDLKTKNLNKADLEKKLTVAKHVLAPEALPMPRTVCTNSKCIDYHRDVESEEVAIVYKTICHDGCSARGLIKSLRTCSAIRAIRGTCKICEHHVNEHMHIAYELRPKTEIVINQDVAKLLEEGETSIAAQKQLIEIKEQKVKEFLGEHDKIQEAACQFSLFLKRNSIAAYNDATIDYLDQQIREETGKVTFGGGKRDRLDRLEASRREHEEMVKTLEESMKLGDGGEPMNENGVQDTLGNLYKLPHYGKILKDIKRVVDHTQEASCREKSYSTRAGSHWVSKSVSKKVENGSKPAYRQWPFDTTIVEYAEVGQEGCGKLPSSAPGDARLRLSRPIEQAGIVRVETAPVATS
ncbi:hypothetical protein G7Y89_g4516 [Cudoniella acicularis]|uniref:G domain-containing protein n=1 Tax=Cudoniella acicularis TaxID=354080 RepID=A0A8H4RQK6_9HELO|nr:hypothetical protein G7Y89_g4516 [Cudoniella acicularis]